jgi:hypothetical protein
VAAAIGQETGKLTSTVAAALVAAGLLSAALFPAGADRLLARGRKAARSSPVSPVGHGSSGPQPTGESGGP